MGVPRRTYHARLARHRAGEVTKGPWLAPVVDRIEPAVEKLAAGWPAWGHRNIWAMGRYDVWDLGSPSSVHRAMACRGLLQPVRYQAERRQLAAARREVFVDPPARRNRVWQVDFSAFETTGEGTWALCGVVDYAAKVALACPVTATRTATDLLGALEAAIDAAETLLERTLIEDCADPATGETTPLVIVTDNGPAMKSTAAARWFGARSHLTHVRTRHRALNGDCRTLPCQAASAWGCCRAVSSRHIRRMTWLASWRLWARRASRRVLPSVVLRAR